MSRAGRSGSILGGDSGCMHIYVGDISLVSLFPSLSLLFFFIVRAYQKTLLGESKSKSQALTRRILAHARLLSIFDLFPVCPVHSNPYVSISTATTFILPSHPATPQPTWQAHSPSRPTSPSRQRARDKHSPPPARLCLSKRPSPPCLPTRPARLPRPPTPTPRPSLPFSTSARRRRRRRRRRLVRSRTASRTRPSTPPRRPRRRARSPRDG